MSEEIMYEGRDIEVQLRRYVGETVTIFTTSGGLSGSGFTGVLLSVNRHFVKIITQHGSAPTSPFGNYRGGYDQYNERGFSERGFNERGFNDYDNRGFRIGSVTDIPLSRIVAFVTNAV